MLKDDRDKLSAIFEHHSEVIDNAANIHTVDLNYFARENQIVGDFNAIDFTDINNYTTLNAIYNKTTKGIEPLYYGTYEGAIKELRKILKAFLYESSVNDWPVSIDYKDNILIGNIFSTVLQTEEKYSNYLGSKLNTIMNYMFSNNKGGDTIPTYGINGLFYYTSDCNPSSPIQSRAISFPSEERSNVLYHIHLLFHGNFIYPIIEQGSEVETIEEYMNIVDKVLTDEVVAQCPFMFCINTTEIPVGNNLDSIIHLSDSMTLPHALESYELTAIINDVERYEYANYKNIKPWAKQLNVNGNDIVEAYIYLPSECGIKHIVIRNNQITQIVKV